jgi:hypothetical protein
MEGPQNGGSSNGRSPKRRILEWKLEGTQTEDPRMKGPQTEDPRMEGTQTEDPRREDPRREDPLTDYAILQDPRTEDYRTVREGILCC